MSDMQAVENLLEDAGRINQQKVNIDHAVAIIIGFVSERSLSRYKMHEEVGNFTSHRLTWRIVKNKKDLTIHANPVGKEDWSTFLYTSLWGANQVSGRHVGPLYRGLADFLEKMEEVFPEIKDRRLSLRP